MTQLSPSARLPMPDFLPFAGNAFGDGAREGHLSTGHTSGQSNEVE
jgi:hypothetical protein